MTGFLNNEKSDLVSKMMLWKLCGTLKLALPDSLEPIGRLDNISSSSTYNLTNNLACLPSQLR